MHKLLKSILTILREQKDERRDNVGSHKWYEAVSEELTKKTTKKSEDEITEEDIIDALDSERKNKYNPYGTSRNIANAKKAKKDFHVDYTWPNGMGPKEYLKKMGL
jgi:hypothetical protein